MVTFRLDSESISLDLPDAAKKEVDFLDSTFFTVPNRHLPSPEEVAALSDGLGKISRPNTLVIGGLNLLTKFGPHVTPLEAANLWMVRRVFNNTVPVPEVFGWRTDDWGYVFIYTEFIKGPTLFEHWPSLGSLEKRAICDQLAGLAQSLRQLEQDPSDPFIDGVAIRFTHADLHRANIIVTPSSAGWYPEYWEYCKALYTASYGDEWRRDGYIERVIDPWEDVYLVWSEYCMAMGAV
ncbi:hypothetical protein BJY00DRAFT_304967 [Aspergillus carlsbadensis]|nr:hypothetical protein BJY00DRAFT_304967 [Aspergillus carlsbadensis]